MQLGETEVASISSSQDEAKLMEIFNSLYNDPEFQDALNDPEFMKAIETNDREAIESNPRYKQLLDIKALKELEAEAKKE